MGEPTRTGTFHELRHTHASHWIAEHGDSVELSKRLGHRNPAITESVYMHDFEAAERSGERRARLARLYGAVPAAAPVAHSEPSSVAPMVRLRSAPAALHTREVAGSKPAAPIGSIRDKRSGRRRQTSTTADRRLPGALHAPRRPDHFLAVDRGWAPEESSSWACLQPSHGDDPADLRERCMPPLVRISR